MSKNSGKIHLQITLWEEEYRIFENTFVINWTHVLHYELWCNRFS